MNKGYEGIEEHPNFTIDRLPNIRIKSIRFEKFKVFPDCEFNFENKNFACFIGTNGTGKSTSLEIIQMIFARYEGYEQNRLIAYLGKGVRHTNIEDQFNGIYGDDDFLITAEIEYENGDYQIQINKSGFIKDHPPEVKEILYRICHTTTFDRDLKKFVIARNKWDKFKGLFEEITGYEIEEYKDKFDMIAGDPKQSETLKHNVLNFKVKKPNETISYKNCSDGERKLIKSLSNLLSLEYTPKIILIDNIEMHIEIKRHKPLVQALKKNFPYSQFFVTTHSYRLSKDLLHIEDIYDLRYVNTNDFLKNNPRIMILLDEIEECIYKASVLFDQNKSKQMIDVGESIKNFLTEGQANQEIIESAKNFIKEVSELFVNDVSVLKKNQNIICR